MKQSRQEGGPCKDSLPPMPPRPMPEHDFRTIDRENILAQQEEIERGGEHSEANKAKLLRAGLQGRSSYTEKAAKATEQ